MKRPTTVTPSHGPGADDTDASAGSDLAREQLPEPDALERARAESRSAWAFFRAGFDALEEHVAILDADGAIVEVNAAWERFADVNGAHRADGWRGVSYLAVCDAAAESGAPEAAAVARGIRELLAGERSTFRLQYPCPTPDAERWFALRAVRFEDAGRPLVYAGHHDVTERHLAERALESSEARYRRLVETSHEGICTVDATGCITYANRRLSEMLGYGPLELAGRPLFAYMDPEVAFRARTRFARRARGISEVDELPLRRQDGSMVWVHKAASSLFDADGAFTGAVYVLADITEQRRAEATLRENERRYRMLFDRNPIPMYVVDVETRQFLAANEAAVRQYGFAPEELRAMRLDDIRPPEDRDAFVDVFVRATGYRRSGEFRHVRKDGSTIDVEIVSDAVTFGDRPARLIMASDITERRRAEIALRESEARFAHIAANVPGMVYEFVFRPDGSAGYSFVSEGARRLFGVDPADAVRDAAVLLDLIHPDDRPRFLALAREAAAALGSVHWEGRVRLPSGDERVVQIAAQDERYPDGTVASHGLVLDVTERRVAEDQLRRQTQLLQAIFDHIPAMITLTDAAGRPIFANREWDRIAGWTIEEARHLDLFTELYPDPVTRERVFAFMRAGTGRPNHFRMRVRDGRTLDTVWASVVLSDGSVLGMGRDVTERRQLEEQLRQAQKMEAVGRLAGGVAHDFNNLIQVITGSTLFAREQLPADSPARADLAEIEAAARRAAALTRQLLAFSRRQVLNPERLDTNRVVTNVERMLRRVIGADVAMVTDLQPGLPMVHADAGQLEQVLLNLAVNARDAMPDGGTLTIETRAVQLDADAALRHGGLEPGTYVALWVRDTGVGMDDETRLRLFEPFFTTKEPGRGTGLGLATVYGIVTQSGGRVLVESAPGAGSTFTILLPASGGVSPSTASVPAARTVGGTETILLVEDDATVRVAVRRMLERGGYAVLEAGRAADALRVLDEPDRRVALVLADVVLPDAGARTLASRIRERRGGVRILLMSGYGGEAVSRQVAAVGDGGLLTKPFTQDELLRRVRDALDAPTL